MSANTVAPVTSQHAEADPPPGGDAEMAVALERFPRARAAAEVRRLSRVSNLHSAITIAFQWLVIVGAGVAAVRVGTWWAYLLGALVIGSRQLALGVLLHDATHYLLFTNRRVNDWVSDLCLAFPIGMSTALYRKTHLAHHRFTNTDADPDWVAQSADDDFRFPKTPREALLLMVRSACGLNLFRMKEVMRQWSPTMNLSQPLSPDFPLSTRVGFVLSTLAIYAVLLPTGWWKPALVLYALPGLTLFHFLNRIRLTAEHIGTPATHELNATRTVLATPLERFLIAPLGVHFHIEHHLYPSVPVQRLSELHAVLMQDEQFRATAHITPSYLGWRRGLIGELLRSDRAAN